MSSLSHADAGAAYALDLCARIAAITDTPGTITRLFLSPATHQVHALLRHEMESLGMSVQVDAAGNLRGLYPGPRPDSPILLLGSHIDTVPSAGAFDGILGVTLPLAVLRRLNGQRLPFAIELIAFSEEEGIRFRMPFIGSRALIGTLHESDLARVDAAGISLSQALHHFNLNPASLAAPLLSPRTFAFLEVHIEQGPVLEALNLPLGIVTTIVGQTRLQLTFTGRANHAGTTPMALRQDALAAAAAFITAVERHANTVPDLIATVGTISVSPGAANVIPAAAVLSLDVRHANDSTRTQAVAALLAEAAQLAQTRGVSVTSLESSRQDAVAMDPQLCDLLANAVAEIGDKPHRMVSGAGHDAMILASRLPSAMLFVRTPAGLSHHPDEAVAEADVQKAFAALAHTLHQLGSSSVLPSADPLCRPKAGEPEVSHEHSRT